MSSEIKTSFINDIGNIDLSTLYLMDTDRKLPLKVRVYYPFTTMEIGSNYSCPEFVRNMKGIVFVSDTGKEVILLRICIACYTSILITQTPGGGGGALPYQTSWGRAYLYSLYF